MRAKKALTDRGIRALKPAPAGKRQLIWDAQVPGRRGVPETAAATAFVVDIPAIAIHPRALGGHGTPTWGRPRKGRVAHTIGNGRPRIGKPPAGLTAYRRSWRALARSQLRTIDPSVRAILERLVLPRFGAGRSRYSQGEIVALLDDRGQQQPGHGALHPGDAPPAIHLARRAR